MKSIALCASLSSFHKLIEVKNQLIKLGYNVLVPDLAVEMETNADFTVPNETLEEKSLATMTHFKKINQSNTILVVNESKNGYVGYIGPAVLMEMAIAFYLEKPIYILNDPDSKLPNLIEIQVLKPIIMNGDLSKINL